MSRTYSVTRRGKMFINGSQALALVHSDPRQGDTWDLVPIHKGHVWNDKDNRIKDVKYVLPCHCESPDKPLTVVEVEVIRSIKIK